MFSLNLIDKYIRFIKEFREFEKLPYEYSTLKIHMIFYQGDDKAKNLLKEWKEMGHDFTHFFLHLQGKDQKKILDYFHIPVNAKRTFIEMEYSEDDLLSGSSLFLPDDLMLINLLLSYFNSCSLTKNVSGATLPHLPTESIKLLGKGANWADYILSLSYKEQVDVVYKILLD